MTDQILAKSSEAPQLLSAELRPYEPSYVDKLMRSVEALPIPYWATYLVLFVLHAVLIFALAWPDGRSPFNQFDSFALSQAVWLWYPLAVMTYLDRTALQALSSSSPLFPIPDEAMARLRYEFSTMPNRPVIVNGLIWTLFYVTLPLYTALIDGYYKQNGIGIASMVISLAIGLPSYFIGVTIFYHTIRQLRLVSRTAGMVEEINTFQLDPVFAFSRLTARTGIAWVFLLAFSLPLVPIQAVPVPAATAMVILWPLILAAFVLPLWNMHRRLVSEKNSLQADRNQRVESMLARLHRSLDEGDLEEMAGINGALAGLEAEREVLSRLPTWPWRSRTLTGFLTAILLPLALFLIQLALERWLGV